MCVGSVCTHPSYNDKIGFPIPILLHASWPIPIPIYLFFTHTDNSDFITCKLANSDFVFTRKLDNSDFVFTRKLDNPIQIFLRVNWPIQIFFFLRKLDNSDTDFFTRKLDNSHTNFFTRKLDNSDFFYTQTGQFRFFLHANWTILIPILFLHTSWTIRYRFFVSQFPQKYCAARLFSTLIIIRNVSYHKSAYDYDF